MRAYKETKAATVITSIMLEMTPEEAGMLKMLANNFSTTVQVPDRRQAKIVHFQTLLWNELDSRGIDAYLAGPGFGAGSGR